MRSLRGSNAPAVIKNSTPSSGDGPPTTGRRFPAEAFEVLDGTCGSSRSSGPGSATRTSRPAGSSPGTGGASTRPAKTGGYSATAKAAPTCTSSSGPTSSGTGSSWAWRHPTTPPCRLLGEAAAQGAPADRQDQPAAPQSPGRSLRDLRVRVPARRRPATKPARVGAVADGRPQGTRQGSHPGSPRAGRTRTPSRTRPLPRRQQPGTSARLRACGACLSRVLGNGHALVLRGARHSNVLGLPVHSTSPAPAGWRTRVAGGAEEPLLARRVRSSKRRRHDAWQLHADDGRARDPAGSPFACGSGCPRPRERRAVGARPFRQRPASASCPRIRPGAYATPGSPTGWPVITTVSLAQAKQLYDVDELADDRKSSDAATWSSTTTGTARPAEACARCLRPRFGALVLRGLRSGWPSTRTGAPGPQSQGARCSALRLVVFRGRTASP